MEAKNVAVLDSPSQHGNSSSSLFTAVADENRQVDSFNEPLGRIQGAGLGEDQQIKDGQGRLCWF